VASRIVTIVLVGVIAVSVTVVARWRPQPLDELAEPRPVEVTLHGDELEWRSGATLEVSVQEGGRLVSNGRLGLVTEVFVKPGSSVASGEPVVAVDGVTVRSLATRMPLYRPIQRGSRGEDVSELQRALTELSLYAGEVSGLADAATMDAVAALLGVEARRSMTLSPEDVIWLPVADLDVSTVSLAMGVPFPPLGVPIVIAPPSVTGVHVALTGGSEGGPPREALVFESLDGSVIVHLDADLAPTSLEPVEAAVTLGAFDDDSEAASMATIQGVVRSTMPHRVVVAPTTAIVVDADETCVWLAEDPARPVAVRVVGSSAVGVTYLDDVDLDGVRVVANPIEVGFDSCSA
jgi:peptidoglycan hydrolase-like protein with peptidoglycan-binding domain